MITAEHQKLIDDCKMIAGMPGLLDGVEIYRTGVDTGRGMMTGDFRVVHAGAGFNYVQAQIVCSRKVVADITISLKNITPAQVADVREQCKRMGIETE